MARVFWILYIWVRCITGFANSSCDSIHLQVVMNTTGFDCSQWKKPTFYYTPEASNHMPRQCKSLKKRICASSSTRFYDYNCENDSFNAFPFTRINHSSIGKCKGMHEVLTRMQVEEGHPTKSDVTQRLVDAINQLGIVISLTGAAGAGKSTISALGGYYGMHTVDLEDTPGKLDPAFPIPIEHPLFNYSKSKRYYSSAAKRYYRRQDLAISIEQHLEMRKQERKSAIVGLAAVSSIDLYRPYVETTVTVLLQPDVSVTNERFEIRNHLVGGHDSQRHDSTGYPLEDEVDVVLHTNGCPEQTLRDVCLGVLWWLHHSSIASEEHRHSKFRFGKFVDIFNTNVADINKAYDELGDSAILGDYQVVWACTQKEKKYE